jgi:ligand-binding sensor domain-containing protein/signal transduction histidine kinase
MRCALRHGSQTLVSALMAVHTAPVVTRCLRFNAWILRALVLAGATCAAAQEGGLQVIQATNPFVCRTWRVEDGLPQDSVTAVLQTRDGYLWVGTPGGLARFDGVRFKSFGPAEGLANLHIRVLYEDRGGNLWVGTAYGLYRYTEGHFAGWTTAEGLANSMIHGVAEDQEGVLWVATATGLSRWHAGRFETVGASAGLPESPWVRGVLVGRRGTLWVAVYNLGLRRWDGRSFVSAVDSPELLHPGFCQLAEDPAGRIWNAQAGKVFCLDGNALRSYGRPEGLPGTRVACLMADVDGVLWAGTIDAGLLRLEGGRFQQVFGTEGGAQEGVQAIAKDRDGNVWIGTLTHGLSQLKRRRVGNRSLVSDGTELAPLSVAESPPGEYWIGTVDRGLYHLRGERLEPVVPHTTTNAYVGVVLATRSGAVWWSDGFRLLQRSETGSIQGFEIQPWPVNDMASCLREDGDGSLWVGSRRGELRRYRAGKWEVVASGLAPVRLMDLCPQPDGTLWVASYGDGLSRIKNDQVTHYRMADGLRSNLIRALLLDSAGTLWIGTEGGGLSGFKNDRLFSVTAAQGLTEETIVQMLEDDAGNLWLGTYRGILRLSLRELEALTAGRASRIEPRLFNRSDGMLSGRCMGGFNCALKTRAGSLWFSTDRGIVVIDPNQGTEATVPSAPRLEEVLVDGRPVGIDRSTRAPEVRISPGSRQLEIRYTSLDLLALDKLRFRYRLQGLDSDWVDAGERRGAYYGYLPPGSYQFQVVANCGTSAWSQSAEALVVTVLPYYWQTWWFRFAGWLAGVLAVSGSAAGWLRHRQKLRLRALERQHAVEQERARIAQDMHDELGSRLTKAGMITGMIGRDLAQAPLPQQRLQTLHETLGEITTAMDELVWAVNPKRDTLDGLANYITRFAQEFFAATPISCVLNVPADLPAATLTAQVRHNLFLAFKEALNNAGRHSGATEVIITIEASGGRLCLEISDNGKGFSTGGIRAGARGLENMRDRLTSIGGRCRLNSIPGRGTTVTLQMPL